MTGAKLRDYHLAKAFGESGALTYVHFSEPGLQPPRLPFSERVITIPRPRAYSARNILRGLTGRWPLPVVNYTSAEMIAQTRDLLRQNRFDLIFADAIQLAACVSALKPEIGAVPVIYDWHNVESELMRRYGDRAHNPLKRWYALRTADRLAKVEMELLESAFGHLVCSERERKAVLELSGSARVGVVENGVDVSYFQPASASACDRVVFVGSMNYSANIDGAVWFARTIWPEVKRRLPKLTFTIVGANPAPAVAALAGIAGVEVTGTVPDTRPYYRDAFAAVVPLRMGSGTRLKILEAMASGAPVISTRLGAEGLAVTPGAEILEAQDTEQWVRSLERLEDSVFRRTLIDAARGLVESRYDWRIIGKRLIQLCADWTGCA